MLKTCRNHNKAFRPHGKTHQNAAIALEQIDLGAQSIGASSVEMAMYFLNNGIPEVHLAFPFYPSMLSDLKEEQIRKIIFMLSSPSQLTHFQDKPEMRFFVEIDTGVGRSGMTLESFQSIGQSLFSMANFKGIYHHNGATYNAKNKAEAVELHQKALLKIRRFTSLLPEGYEVVYGDTPSCSLAEEFDGVSTLAPGNFIYYDLMQANIGACDLQEIACALKCPVVDIRADSIEILIHAGAVHLSKETINGHFGFAVKSIQDNWDIEVIGQITKISQEHGLVKLVEGTQIPKGLEFLCILPVHSCLMISCMKENYRIVPGR